MPARVSSCLLLLTLFILLLALVPITDLEGIDAQSTTRVSEPEKQGMLPAGTPHGPIEIDGDANFLATALLEGWPGDGSPENPYLIDGLDIDLAGGVGECISINNIRVSFIIRNCTLTGANGEEWISGVGIILENVTNCELVNNTCNNNSYFGICLRDSDSNIVMNNVCNNNTYGGIFLWDSDSNIVTDNTCSNSTWRGITLEGSGLDGSDSNTVVNNTCFSNEIGITLRGSGSNIVSDNTCTSNSYCGITLEGSGSNTVANNICNSNRIGIYIGTSFGVSITPMFNTVSNNICTNNTESGIYISTSNSTTVANNTCTSNGCGISLEESYNNTVKNNACSNNGESGIYLKGSESNTVISNNCSSNTQYGVYLDDSHRNTVSKNICNSNRIGIYLDHSSHNTVTHNTFLNNTEHDIFLHYSHSNTVEPNITTGFYSGLLLFGGVLFLLPVGIVVLGSRWHIASAFIQRTSYRLVFWFRENKGEQDDIKVPARYRLSSWFRARRSLKHEIVDESLEPDPSDQ